METIFPNGPPGDLDGPARRAQERGFEGYVWDEPAVVDDNHEVGDAAQFPLTDAGNAETFVSMFRDLVRYDHARGRWLIWDAHRWRPDNDAAAHRMALNAVRKRGIDAMKSDDLDYKTREQAATWALRSESRARLDAALALARTMTPVTDSGHGWDAAKGLLGVPNGVVELRTGALRDGRPEDRITMHAGAPYDPTAECPRWERFLLEVLEDPEVVTFVKRLVGYSLTAEANLDMLVFLMGIGSNGKTTLLEVLRTVAGDYGREISALAVLESRAAAHSTEVADLELSRLATCEELGDARLNANRLKQLSGGSSITARKIRSDTITFPATWQLWFTTNGLPRADDNSWAFWRRVIAIDFPNVFDRDDDPNLEEDIASEGRGILRWMVEGAVEFYAADKTITVPSAVREKTTQYREDVDPLEAVFEAGFLVKDSDAWTPTVHLYGAYLRWADSIGIPMERRYGQDGFGKALSGRFGRKRGREEGKQLHGFSGVRMAGPSQVDQSA